MSAWSCSIKGSKPWRDNYGSNAATMTKGRCFKNIQRGPVGMCRSCMTAPGEMWMECEFTLHRPLMSDQNTRWLPSLVWWTNVAIGATPRSIGERFTGVQEIQIRFVTKMLFLKLMTDESRKLHLWNSQPQMQAAPPNLIPNSSNWLYTFGEGTHKPWQS